MAAQESTRILLTKYREHTICARFVGFHMTDVQVLQSEVYKVGDIVIGKVHTIRKGIGAAFVSLGSGPDAYLSLDDAHEITYTSGDADTPLRVGDEILVQVTKEAYGSKALTVSANLMFTGRTVILMSGKRNLGVSNRIPAGRKKELRQLIEPLMPEGFGVIVRSAAENASVIEISEELSALSSSACEKLSVWKRRTCFSVVEQSDSQQVDFIHAFRREGIDEIVTDLPEEYDILTDFFERGKEADRLPVRLYEDPQMPLSNIYGIASQIEHALSRKVFLSSGAWIYIEHTEAMTVIDVNTGKNQAIHENRAGSKSRAVLEVNMEAAGEIARQIRLRNLSGIIVTDFIDMDKEEDREALMQALRDQTADDPCSVHVVDLTALQLCEMTRKRVKRPLAEQLSLDEASYK